MYLSGMSASLASTVETWSHGPRVLVLTRYGRLSPTTRVRFLQFIEQLEQDGGRQIEFEFCPLLEDHSLRRFYEDGSRSYAYMLKRYFMRLGLLLTSKQYDLLWVEKELFPVMPAFAERLLAMAGVKVIADYDDAAFAWYQGHPNWFVRTFLSRKIDVVCRSATTVVAGNQRLATYASDAGASNIVVIPSTIDTTRYQDIARSRRAEDEFVVGWIGTPSNARYLEIFKDALLSMSAAPNFKFLTIGAPGDLFAGVNQEAHPWSEETEAALLARCDCSIAPLGNGNFEKGKCGFKVIQGMAAGLPVIASPVGVIKEIIRHGENGFLVTSASECHEVLRYLQADPAARLRIGQSARDTVSRLYSKSTAGALLASVLGEALGTAPEQRLASLSRALPDRSLVSELPSAVGG